MAHKNSVASSAPVLALGLGICGVVVSPREAPAQVGVESYCAQGAHGTTIRAFGSASLTANDGHGDLTLIVVDVPEPAFGYFGFGDLRTPPTPFGRGMLCVGGTSGLFFQLATLPPPAVDAPLLESASGPWYVPHPGTTVAWYSPDYASLEDPAHVITSGSTWHFQFGFRVGREWDLSDALSIQFGPPLSVAHVTTVEQGDRSHHPLVATGGVQIVDDLAEWREFYALHTGDSWLPASPPPVDFERSIVVASFGGRMSSGGFEFRIRRLEASVTTLYVESELRAPGIGCSVTWEVTQPYHFVAIPRIAGVELGSRTVTVSQAPPCQ